MEIGSRILCILALKSDVIRLTTRDSYTAAVQAPATPPRARNVERHFGFEGPRDEFAERLMRGAPADSVRQWQNTGGVEEEDIAGTELMPAGEPADDVLNIDTVSQEVASASGFFYRATLCVIAFFSLLLYVSTFLFNVYRFLFTVILSRLTSRNWVAVCQP